MRVLFVEDDAAVAESTRRLLELEGFQVECAVDGEAGLALARSQSYDVILLDRRLPKISGDQVLEHLRHDGNWTPVLIFTGYPDVDSAFEAGLLRAARYLTKSMISRAELAAAIRKAAASVEPQPRKMPRLFSAYGGRHSEGFTNLAAYVGAGHDLTPVDLLRALVRVISGRDLTFVEFIAAARSVHLLHSKAHLPLSVVLPKLQAWIEEASSSTSIDPRLEEVLGHLEEAGKDWAKVTEAEVLADLPAGDRAGAFYVTDSLTVTFHHCRRAVVMRLAVLELLSPTEHVRQVAYRLGYSDHGNFDHDFHDFFGVTPKEFRRLQ